MNRSDIPEILRRIKLKTATEAEMQLAEQYWKEAVADTSSVDCLEEEEREDLRKFMLMNTLRQIQLAEVTKAKHSIQPWVWRVAASIVLIIFTSVMVNRYVNRSVEIQTSYGEHLTITLPDKSTVVLNGNSRLTYNNNWSDNHTREVWIDGEGFFSVTHTLSHQKFIVHTSNQLNVEVLGTKFNVKSRLQTSEVMLTEGKVKLNLQDQNNQQSVYLKPGELATLQNQQISTRTVVQKQFTSWVNNTLYFDRTTLQEVALIIQQTYGLQVIFTDPNLKDRELSGEISSATIDDVLLAISETFNLEVQRKEDSLIISHASKN